MFDNSRDLPDDLERLQTLRIWHALWLERIDRKAAELRRRQAQEERGRASRPPVPDWILELSRATGHPLAVHVGDCGMAGRRRRPVGQDEARRILATTGVPACPICRPDTSLHIAGLASPTMVALVRRPPRIGRRSQAKQLRSDHPVGDAKSLITCNDRQGRRTSTPLPTGRRR
ncbi:DUF6233 domain-containing protein [Streptomyces prunicolor]|uniref:DUF6233 domain-containing protein n=1 Tax=Streptomyces prunicolor TaxID=67348 RepID=UPI0033F3235D